MLKCNLELINSKCCSWISLPINLLHSFMAGARGGRSKKFDCRKTDHEF